MRIRLIIEPETTENGTEVLPSGGPLTRHLNPPHNDQDGNRCPGGEWDWDGDGFRQCARCGWSQGEA